MTGRSYRGPAWRRERLVAFLALAAIHGCAPDEAHVRRTAAVMGTLAQVEVWAESEGAARQATEAVVDELSRVEGVLSSWRDDTEVGRINAAPVGEAVRVSPEALDFLVAASEWAEVTGGAFHPAVGALVDAWDLRGEGRVPGTDARTAAVAATGAAAVHIDVGAGTVTRVLEGAWLDAGGFGKGAALRNVADTLRARGVSRARIDLGGQLLVVGGEAVTVGVAHPARRGEVAARIAIAGVSVATSGQSERSLEVDGRQVGHILDPRTGEPVPPWGSVTVVAADPLVADILATAFVVLGPEEGMAVAEGLDEVGVLFLDDSGPRLTARHNAAMGAYIDTLPG